MRPTRKLPRAKVQGRIELWERVRAAVRDGDQEAGREALRALGYTKQATADAVLEQIHKQLTRRVPR